MTLLAIEDMAKTYDKVTALTGINLSVEAGEFVTLLGPSGSGKTTLLMSLAGFITPSKGTISLDGKDITHLDPEDRDFDFVLQGYALFPHLSVANNIPRAAGRRAHRMAAPRGHPARLGHRRRHRLSRHGDREFLRRRTRAHPLADIGGEQLVATLHSEADIFTRGGRSSTVGSIRRLLASCRAL
ncbi:ATP-binding cassette domain-containing protein [Mesorhizobium sp.]|jgi:ABC-type Fe3+/spermidine/putrescine transport system ATPase subunit|uniref:ATP-binding cassette domain-containing protein n=1 Tax=Mesorhizobium sp. TaxID=1871066 RepID=UPI003567B71B